MPKAQTTYSRTYNKKAYDRIELTVPKGDREEVKKYIQENYIDTGNDTSMTTNKLLNQLLYKETNGRAGKGEDNI